MMRFTIENHPAAEIVLIAPHSRAMRYAGDELRKYLQLIFGEELPIRETDRYPAGDVRKGRVCLCPFDRLPPSLLPTFSADGRDDIATLCEDGCLTISGRTEQAIIYAVYDFLTETMGCRFLHPDEEIVPSRASFALPAMRRTYHPPLEYREDYYLGNTDIAWKLKNKLNGHFDQIPDELGGHCLYEPFVHSFDVFLPAEKHFADHPEWFSEVDGRRISIRTQLCLSSEAVYEQTLAQVRARLLMNPGIRIVSISQNDWQNPCRCANCRKGYEEEGSDAGIILRFVNRIAQALEKEYPDVAFDTLAYQFSRRPPKRTRPRPNVIVRLCDIENCFAHPLESCRWEGGCSTLKAQQTSFADDLIDWSKICDRLYIWDYVTNFAHYLQPFPNLRVLQPNMRFFVQHGVRGVFCEGNNAVGTSGELDALRQYLLARLLWNPDTDVAADIQDFLTGYYREAAPQVDQYIRYIDACIQKEGVHMGIYDPPTAPYLKDAYMVEAIKILSRGESNAQEEETRRRVRVIALSPRYVLLRHQSANTPGFKEKVEQFLNDVRSNGITQLTEGCSLEKTYESFMAQK